MHLTQSLTATTAPEQGQLVQVRSRPWVVNEIKTSILPSPAMELPVSRSQHLLTLASIEDDGLGEELQVVWEIEPGAKVIEKVALPEPSSLDSPAELDAFLDAVRWGAASTADYKNIQSPFRSGVEIEDYQLDPVVRAIQMPRVNLLIADDVGLGKTIEAGMVGLELIIRHRARTILIVCPSSLQIQWRDQMRDKFGLDFRIVDSELMRDLRCRRGIHANPWSHFPRLITSIDFLVAGTNQKPPALTQSRCPVRAPLLPEGLVYVTKVLLPFLDRYCHVSRATLGIPKERHDRIFHFDESVTTPRCAPFSHVVFIDELRQLAEVDVCQDIPALHRREYACHSDAIPHEAKHSFFVRKHPSRQGIPLSRKRLFWPCRRARLN